MDVVTLTAAPERLVDCYDEWATMHPEHFEALALDKDRAPLAPDRDLYLAMEATGHLMFIGLREDGKLVGYFVAFVAPCARRGGVMATMDVFWVSPGARGRFGGVKLFGAARRELRARGVERWTVGEKLHTPAAPLFRWSGLAPADTYHSKWIGS